MREHAISGAARDRLATSLALVVTWGGIASENVQSNRATRKQEVLERDGVSVLDLIGGWALEALNTFRGGMQAKSSGYNFEGRIKDLV